MSIKNESVKDKTSFGTIKIKIIQLKIKEMTEFTDMTILDNEQQYVFDTSASQRHFTVAI